MSDSGRPNGSSQTPARRGWTRWTPEPIRQAATSRPQPAQPRPTPEPVDPDRMIQLARKRAVDQGYAEGHTAGYAQGLEQGRADGLRAGHEAGYAEGHAAGHAAGAEAAREAAQQLDTLVQACATAINGLEADMGQAMVTLATRIAEHVLHSTLKDQPDRLLDLVSELVRTEPGHTAPVQLILHPADADRVRAWLQSDPDAATWRIVTDDGITPGGCRVATAFGEIDATLETRWNRAMAALGAAS